MDVKEHGTGSIGIICYMHCALVEVTLPVHIGDIVAKDIAGTGVNVVATRNALL